MKKTLVIFSLASLMLLNAGPWDSKPTQPTKNKHTPNEDFVKAVKDKKSFQKKIAKKKIANKNPFRERMRKDLMLNSAASKNKTSPVDFRKGLFEQQNNANAEANKNNALIDMERNKKIETDPGAILKERKRKQREERLRKIRERQERFKNRLGR